MDPLINPTHAPAADFPLAAVEAVADPIARLRVIMKRLLDPGGCPWDREQNHRTLRQYLIEEAHEAAEAIEDGDDAALAEELGDVGLQVIFHAELAERDGRFNLEDVYTHICNKLISRHPHVFGEAEAADSAAVLKNWEQLKKIEKQKKAEAAGANNPSGASGAAAGPPVSALSGVPRALPALQRAGRIQEKAARVGFDWPKVGDVAAKVREEIEEFLEAAQAHSDANHSNSLPKNAAQSPTHDALTDEFGDLLFSLVNLSRFLHLRPEEALSAACNKFTRRFTAIERAADSAGRKLNEMTLAEMDALWDAEKEAEKTRRQTKTD